MAARQQLSHCLAAPSAGVFRVATAPWPFAFLPPRSALIDDTQPVLGGNRWDDPRATFPTLYCASSAEAAFAETISRYREDPGLLDRIDSFLTGPADDEYDVELRPGHVPEDYFDNRYLGHIGLPVVTEQERTQGDRRVDRHQCASGGRARQPRFWRHAGRGMSESVCTRAPAMP